MRLLFFVEEDNDRGAAFLETIHPLSSRYGFEVSRTFEKLFLRLRRPGAGFTILVLFISTTEALDTILSIHELIQDSRNVLILPDREPTTIVRALTLRPRFFTFADGDYSDLVAVLEKMILAYTRNGKLVWIS